MRYWTGVDGNERRGLPSVAAESERGTGLLSGPEVRRQVQGARTIEEQSVTKQEEGVVLAGRE